MRLSPNAKRAVRKLARNCCEYCQSPEVFSPTKFSIEHIVPRVAGGSDEADNLALACQECNNHKFTAMGAQDPMSGEMVPLYSPRGSRWVDHFVWSDNFTVLLALTPTGRATIERLQLNRAGLINLRRVLVLAGVHPLPVEEG